MSRSMVKTGVQPTRPHDHIYDPVYTVSSQNVHLQEHQRSRMSNVERIPVFKNMYSDVPTHPRHNYRMKLDKHSMPPFPPGGGVRAVSDQSVLGQLRFKYFKRPVVPFLHSVPAEILLAPVHDTETNPLEATLEAEEPLVRTVGSQTLYRESEAQTDPYTADYITDPGQEDPEMLSLAHLTYGHGLPASLDEINMIHRMREKKAFEDSLPPITDEASFQLRKQLLEERELKEWQVREEEKKKEQEDRLQILIDTLREREEKTEQLNEARVDKVRQQKMRQRDLVFDQINQQRIKAHRSLTKSRAHMEPSSNKRDIIQEHSEFASKVYAPIAREGRLPVKNQVVDYGIPLISNFQGLCALEASLPANISNVKVHQPAQIIPKSAQGRKGQMVVQDLAYVDKLLDDSKKPKHATVIENVYKKFEPVLRAPTPSVTAPPNEEKDRVILLLQRLLRGRSMQNTMYQGKQKCLQVIRELRIAEDPIVEPLPDPNEKANNALDSLMGEVFANALDFISKDIVRVSEERKIAALVKEAVRTRRVRESEESGRRQAEDVLRNKREQQFNEIMAVHHSTADRYLDTILFDAVETCAERSARKQARLKAGVLETLVADMESKYNEDDIIVQDLVGDFLLPEVERRRLERGKVVAGRRFLSAAHSALLGGVTEVVKELPAIVRQLAAEVKAKAAAEADAEVEAARQTALEERKKQEEMEATMELERQAQEALAAEDEKEKAEKEAAEAAEAAKEAVEAKAETAPEADADAKAPEGDEG